MEFRRIATSTTLSGFAWEGWTHSGLTRRVVVFALRPRRWIVQIDGIAQEIPESDRATLSRDEKSWGYTDGFIARTRAAAMRAAEVAYSAVMRAEYTAAEASGFAADKEAGAKAGTCFAADMMALPAFAPERCEKARMIRRGSDYLRLAANAHCGVFAPEVRKHAFMDAWHDAARAEVARIAAENRAAENRATSARAAENRAAEMKRDSETDEEHSARLFGRTFGRQDSGASPFTGAPRESRIAHLAYLEACDTPRAKTAFRIGYLETFRGTKESGQ